MKEYKLITMGMGSTKKAMRRDLEQMLNEMGAAGWELKLTVALGYIFEREKFSYGIIISFCWIGCSH